MVPNGWKKKKLDEVTSLVLDGTHFSPKSKAGPYKYITSKNIRFGKMDLNDISYISAEEHELIHKRCPVKYGDLLLTKDGANTGNAALNELNEEFSLLSSVAVIRANPEFTSNKFLLQTLLSPKCQSMIKDEMAGQAITRLTLQKIKSFEIMLPPKNEQKKITQILSTWDKAITTTEKLLTNSEQQKKALVQQLLTGKKRFSRLSTSFNYTKTRYGTIPADWEHPAIRDICSQISEKNSTKANYPVLSCSKYDGFVDSLKYFKKKVYSDDTSAYRLIPRGCFGFPSNHIEEGSIGLQNSHDFGIVSPIYVVFRANPKRVNNQYLFALLKTEHYRQIFSAATNASVDRRGSLRWDEFSSIHVPLPTLEEQNEIASTLSLVDQEIEILKQTLEHLKQEKKALMQQLLTGKRRVRLQGDV